MKKFVYKISMFVIIVALNVIAVNLMYVNKIRSIPNETDKFTSIPETIQICNFGSSHGMYGFDYEEIEDNYVCFNFGLAGQFLSYDYRLFQHYSAHITEGTIVFIPISYFSFFAIEEVRDADFKSKNQRYYSILPASLIKEYSLQTNFFVKYLPAFTTTPGNLINMLLRPTSNSLRQVTTTIEFIENGKYEYEKEIKRYLDDDGNTIENHEEIGALYALIKGCQKKGAIPIMITTPYLHEFTDQVKKNSPDFYDHFYSIINQVAKDTGAEYYDYAFDERFVNKYSWFMDSHHLNNKGAKSFVNILMNEIVFKNGYY